MEVEIPDLHGISVSQTAGDEILKLRNWIIPHGQQSGRLLRSTKPLNPKELRMIRPGMNGTQNPKVRVDRNQMRLMLPSKAPRRQDRREPEDEERGCSCGF